MHVLNATYFKVILHYSDLCGWLTDFTSACFSSVNHRHSHQSHHQWTSAFLRHHSHRHQTGEIQALFINVAVRVICPRLNPFCVSPPLRQGYEDWLRHKADNSVNQCPVHVVQHGKVVRKQSRKLRVWNTVHDGAFVLVARAEGFSWH